MPKDHWDKAEIIAKFLGAVFVPLVVGISVWAFNVQAGRRDTAAQMAQIAVGILSQQPTDGKTGGDALRSWAIDVLQNPTEVNPLSPDAANQLRFSPLMLWKDIPESKFATIPELLERLDNRGFRDDPNNQDEKSGDAD